MTKQQAIDVLQDIVFDYWYMSHKDEVEEAVGMAVRALDREQKILDAGYTGKEVEFRIGGRLFGIREKAQ